MKSPVEEYRLGHQAVEGAIAELKAHGISDEAAAIGIARLAFVHLLHTHGARETAAAAYHLADIIATTWGKNP